MRLGNTAMVEYRVVATAARANRHDVTSIFSLFNAGERFVERINCSLVTQPVRKRWMAGQRTNAILHQVSIGCLIVTSDFGPSFLENRSPNRLVVKTLFRKD